MPVPNVKDLHRPILEYAIVNGEVFSNKELVGFLKDKLSIDDNALEERAESGRKLFTVRLAAAHVNLKRAGLLRSPRDGRFIITPQGIDFIEAHKSYEGHITGRIINRWKRERERAEVLGDNNTVSDELVPTTTSSYTKPNGDIDESDDALDEIIDDAYQQLQDKLTADMLDSLKSVEPSRFERIVGDLLEKMGYGKAQQIGGAVDCGIEDVINQDSLGLEKVYIQAKCCQYTVANPTFATFQAASPPMVLRKACSLPHPTSAQPQGRRRKRFPQESNSYA